ncbi:ABC transporter substrate-binding protein [Cohnella nanjingensis]|uniref:Carbohydrate ABC transporter substrate-binding protein n=1 Tax=Cohnella nanjingensis TaxID=1387779 RepID=A0A7X0VEC9_9BACL|nr:ABC transporter substrate-binding protein [Cohnella nanjingensis]MBB6670148.1 carbohydrate ABC transporter substrate-binding protein [Cohnella nanjingensis]
MKKAATALLTLSLAAGLTAACGGGGKDDAASPSGSASASAGASASKGGDGEKVTLRVAWWGGQSRHDYTLKVIDLYQQKHPNVKIETEYAAFDDYWKKLAPQAAANQLPDVIQMDISYLSQYGSKGQLEDLKPYIDKGLIDTSNVSDSVLSGGKVKDTLYAFNLGSNALASIVDLQLLKDNGIDVPTNEWTWDDYTDIGAKLKEKGKIFGGFRFDVFFPFYLRGQGKHMYAADGTGLGYEDQQFIDYFTMYKGWYDNGYLLSLDKESQKKGTPEEDEMVPGHSFSSNGWSNQYILLANAVKRPIDLLPVPGWNQNKALFLKPSMYFSIPQSSKAKEEAAKFIDFWVNDVEANKIIMGERGVPISSKIKEELKPLLTPEQTKVFDYVAWAEQNASEMDPPNPVGATEVDALLKSYGESILYKKITIEDAAAKFRKEAEEILAKNK